MYIRLHVKYPLFLSDFNETLIFLTYFSTNTQIWKFMENHPVQADLFHADRQRLERHDVANSYFSQFHEAA